MRKVVLYVLTSLDGAVDDPRRYFVETDPAIHGPPVFDPTMVELETRLIGAQDAVLLGRGMYDEWVDYWPTSQEQPFADFINRVRKYVVTSTPLTKPWSNAQVVTAPVADFLEDLRSQQGADIGVHGSIELAQHLLGAGLVDELHLAVGPVLDPVGRRLFDGVDGWRRLQLTSATPTPSGAVWLTYRLRA